MSKTKGTTPRFRVGDWVSFTLGAIHVVARIIEDRGPLGVGGRRLYRIETQFEDGEMDRFEVREDDLSPATPPAASVKAS
jgi:hypothetical protein